MDHLLIAIDGPAGSGKSTLARALAEALGLSTLDTGSSYRAMTAAILGGGFELENQSEVARFAQNVAIDMTSGTTIDGHDYSDVLRTEEVNKAVSLIAANGEVRGILVAWQRAWADLHGGGVVEGRDIGTVVFPDAQIKLYLTASPTERAKRRPEEGLASIERRDAFDSTRKSSPLSIAEDAWEIDTTDRPVSDIVGVVLEKITHLRANQRRD